MNAPDAINGCFELAGAVFLMRNCWCLYGDKQVKGVSIVSAMFFAAWGSWNTLVYYPSLHQMFSFFGGAVMLFANVMWVSMAFHFRRRESKAAKLLQGLYEHARLHPWSRETYFYGIFEDEVK